MLKLGIPGHLNYAGLKKQPFWQLKERFALRKLESGLQQEAAKAIFWKNACSQGYPTRGVDVEFAKTLAKDAASACRRYVISLMPWAEASLEQSEEDKKQELLGGSAGMIEAWIAYFEPENLPAYREAMNEAMERAQADAG